MNTSTEEIFEVLESMMTEPERAKDVYYFIQELSHLHPEFVNRTWLGKDEVFDKYFNCKFVKVDDSRVYESDTYRTGDFIISKKVESREGRKELIQAFNEMRFEINGFKFSLGGGYDDKGEIRSCWDYDAEGDVYPFWIVHNQMNAVMKDNDIMYLETEYEDARAALNELLTYLKKVSKICINATRIKECDKLDWMKLGWYAIVHDVNEFF